MGKMFFMYEFHRSNNELSHNGFKISQILMTGFIQNTTCYKLLIKAVSALMKGNSCHFPFKALLFIE